MSFYANTKHAIRFWLLRRLPACKETVKVISESMERPLTLRERLLLKVHMAVCSWCQWYMEHLLIMREALRTQTAEPPEANFSSPGLSPEARERIRQKLHS